MVFLLTVNNNNNYNNDNFFFTGWLNSFMSNNRDSTSKRMQLQQMISAKENSLPSTPQRERERERETIRSAAFTLIKSLSKSEHKNLGYVVHHNPMIKLFKRQYSTTVTRIYQ
jgi:hypothetical protein